MSSLYNIDHEYNNAINLFLSSFDENGEAIEGSDPEAAQELMNQLENQRDEKINNILKFRANLISDEVGINAEIERLQKMKDGINKKEQKLTDYLEAIVGKQGKDEKYAYGNWIIKWNKGTSTVIDDESKVPDKYKKEKISIAIDKTAIKEAIKAGEVIEGARLETTYNMKIA